MNKLKDSIPDKCV